MDVTLVTFGTVDRIGVLRDTLSTWNGLIFVAIYITSDDDIKELEYFMQSSNAARRQLTVHLLWAEGDANTDPFPVNALRNLALTGVPTTHFLYADMDFVPSFGSRLQIIKEQKLLKDSYTGKSRQMLVLPAFQCARPSKRSECGPLEFKFNYMQMWQIKQLARFGQFDSFGGRYRGYHGSTDLNKFLRSAKPYAIPAKAEHQVSVNYEPYAVLPTRIRGKNSTMNPFLLWDEIFTAYGRNKIIYLSMLRQLFNYQFTVLPTAALFHKHHVKSNESKSFDANARIEMVAMFKARMEFWNRVRHGLSTGETSVEEFMDENFSPVVDYRMHNAINDAIDTETVSEYESSREGDVSEFEEIQGKTEVHSFTDDVIKGPLELEQTRDIILLSTGDGQALKVCNDPLIVDSYTNWSQPIVSVIMSQFLESYNNESYRLIERSKFYHLIDIRPVAAKEDILEIDESNAIDYGTDIDLGRRSDVYETVIDSQNDRSDATLLNDEKYVGKSFDQEQSQPGFVCSQLQSTGTIYILFGSMTIFSILSFTACRGTRFFKLGRRPILSVSHIALFCMLFIIVESMQTICAMNSE